MEANVNIDKAIQFIRFFEEINPYKTNYAVEEIVHPKYRAGTQSIDNTWNQIWRDIDPSIEYQSGIESLLKRLSTYAKYMGNVKYEILDIFTNAEKVLIHSIISFDHIGEIIGFPATEKRISIESFYTFTFADDLVISSTVNIDFYQWLTEIGASLIEEGDKQKIIKYLDSLRSQNILPAYE